MKFRLVEDVDEKRISIDNVSSPEELMDWMNENITYELVDDEYSNSNGVPTKTAEEVLETGTGHCAEQSYLEKEVLDNLGYETFLVMLKENNSKKEYGAEGSAHVFLVYKDGEQFCWFEHSMQHSRGIHKYNSLEELLQDVANQWWRYDKNSDILEVRMMDKYITGVDNWGLAKECYKLPVAYIFDISDNNLESEVPEEFDPPYNEEQIKANYGDETYQRLIDDPAHAWRMKTGLELIHKEPEKTELKRIWGNWLLMTPEQKAESDKKSIELFGKTNAENYKELIKLYESIRRDNKDLNTYIRFEVLDENGINQGGLFRGLNNLLKDLWEQDAWEYDDLNYPLSELESLTPYPENLSDKRIKFAYTRKFVNEHQELFADIEYVLNNLGWELDTISISNPSNIIYKDNTQIAYM